MCKYQSILILSLIYISALLLSGCASKATDVLSEISTSISLSETPNSGVSHATAALSDIASKTATPKSAMTPTSRSSATNKPHPSATHLASPTPLPSATSLMPPEVLLPNAGTICEGAFNKNITGGNLIFPLTAFKKIGYEDRAAWERFDFIRFGSLQVPHLSPRDPADSEMLVCVLQDHNYRFSYSTGTKAYSHNWRVRFISIPSLKVLEERSYSGPEPSSIISYFGTAPVAVYGDEPTGGDLYQYLLNLANDDLIIFSHTMSFYEGWFSPEGDEVSVLRSDGQILTYSLDNQLLSSERKTANIFSSSLHQAFDQGKQLAMIEYGQINIVNPETDAVLFAFWPEGEENYANFWIARNNRHLAALDTDNTIDIWDLENKNRMTQLILDQPVIGAAWAPDGSKLAVVDEKSLLHVWDFSTQTWEYLSDFVALDAIKGDALISGLAYTPDGSLLAIGLRDGSLRLLRSTDLAEIESLKSGSVVAIENLVWSNDGSLLAFSSDIDIYISAISPLAIIQVMDGHRSLILDLSFSSDGNLLLSQSADSTIRVWSLR